MPNNRNRRSIRLDGYDYSQPGAYFVTLVLQNRRCLLGEIADGAFIPSVTGSMVENWWAKLPAKFPNLQLDEFVLMPNHLHGIVVMDEPVAGQEGSGSPVEAGVSPGAALNKAIQWFKTMTTNEYIRAVRQEGMPRFSGRLWQRDYYEHVIRNTRSLESIRFYIADNPAVWANDRENPSEEGHLPPSGAADPWRA